MISDPQFIRPQSTGLSCLGQYWSFITSCNESQKQFPGLMVPFSWFGLPYQEIHWQRYERLPQTTAGIRVSQRWIFWTYNVIISITDTIFKYMSFDVTRILKCEIRHEVNWMLKFEGLTSKGDKIHIHSESMDQNWYTVHAACAWATTKLILSYTGSS